MNLTMENEQDFVIEDGVLKGYTGPGGDMAIPEVAAETVEDAFRKPRRIPRAGTPPRRRPALPAKPRMSRRPRRKPGRTL